MFIIDDIIVTCVDGLIALSLVIALLTIKKLCWAFPPGIMTSRKSAAKQKCKAMSPVQELERKINRRVSIDDIETNGTLAKCNLQAQSPLFSVLPREIRELVWAFATSPFENEKHRYNNEAYYYRPGHTARLKTDTALLLLCRRIWLEANALAMLQAEHCFWYHRAAPDSRSKKWMATLTQDNCRNFGHLHLFAQMYTIEGLTSVPGKLRHFFLDESAAVAFQPRMLHVTIRHTDWWNWESEQPLRFRDSWLQALLDSPDLRGTQTLKLELETLDYKVDQLLPIVQRLETLESREFETHMLDGTATSTKFVLQPERQVHTWSGPTKIDGRSFQQYKGRDKLNYHVITLTWRLRFPSVPRANVSILRLAPRVSAGVFSGRRISVDSDADKMTLFDARGMRFYGPTGIDDGRLYFERPMRRRDLKRLRAGRFPPRAFQVWERMMDDSLRVRIASARQARRQDTKREGLFVEAMALMHLKALKKRWEAEKSLLCVEE